MNIFFLKDARLAIEILRDYIFICETETALPSPPNRSRVETPNEGLTGFPLTGNSPQADETHPQPRASVGWRIQAKSNPAPLSGDSETEADSA